MKGILDDGHPLMLKAHTSTICTNAIGEHTNTFTGAENKLYLKNSLLGPPRSSPVSPENLM
jgi:hypothetical protein